MFHFTMPCPAFDDRKDDVCEEPMEIEYMNAEPATWTYPGAPAEFEIVECKCDHKDIVERGKYADDVWEYIRDKERAALEDKLDRQYEDSLYYSGHGVW